MKLVVFLIIIVSIILAMIYEYIDYRESVSKTEAEDAALRTMSSVFNDTFIVNRTYKENGSWKVEVVRRE